MSINIFFFKARYPALIFLIAFSALLFSAPLAQAQESQDAAPVATPEPEQASPSGEPPQRRRMAVPPAPKAAPAGAPATERQGDDLIVHAPGGDYTVAGFFKDMAEDMQRPLTVVLPDRGGCVMQIGTSGAVLDMVCGR